jgi:hypothetical protein
MNRKKAVRLNPSEADLKESIYSWVDDAQNTDYIITDEVPKGWATVLQLAEHKNIPRTTMDSRLTKYLKAGLVQRKKFRIKTGCGVVSTWHYYKK